MKRTTLFFTVDAVAFALFVGLVATGALVRYTLPPGSGHFRTLWGLDRHGWGQIHFWLAVVLLAVLATHVFFHWKWIVSMVRGRRQRRPGARSGLALVALAAMIGLVASPFLAPVKESGEPPSSHRPSSGHGDVEADEAIRGSMTLREVERLTGVPAGLILDGLGLSRSISDDERLGRLRNAHGFEIDDIRAIVAEHQES